MTIDEAIKDIKDNIKPVVGGISLDMAIEALEFRKRYDYFWEEVKIRRHEGERDRDSPQRKSVQNQGGGAMTIPITGDILTDVLTLMAIAWVSAILLLPVGQWIAYKQDCKKYGKELADEIWRRIR